ncbi:MAG: hypothetical protein F6K41_12590 [Symploca sp. SIO3E6]|nr:hypothetical protein [Caldora sp. SIO3E6]
MGWVRLSIITIVSFLIATSGALLTKSTLLPLCGIFTSNSVTCKADIEATSLVNAATSYAQLSSCQAAIQAVTAKLRDEQNIEIVSVTKRDVSEIYSDYPKERPGGYFITMRGNQVINLLNSPQLMSILTTQIIDNCETASLVMFGFPNSDFTVPLGLMPNGTVQPFECLEVSLEELEYIEKPVWGKTFCF